MRTTAKVPRIKTTRPDSRRSEKAKRRSIELRRLRQLKVSR
jgi:hypothetical protein